MKTIKKRRGTSPDGVQARDSWPCPPRTRGEWLNRLDFVTGWDGPWTVTDYVVHSWSVGGLQVAGVGEGTIRAACGWEARWSPDEAQCGGGEWLGIDTTPEEG